MENKKYYTPSIEEFNIGFEYEGMVDYYKDKYEVFIVKNTEDLIQRMKTYQSQDMDWIKIKYLDKEDIESLGFTYIKDVFSLNKLTVQSYKKDNIILYHTSELNKIMITYSNEDIIVSSISIKNKSELIKLLKALNIN